uniref:Uncharacterized protein n=1 Tax=Timspurckia oligopyrenoides TaxID=708627 RepID=A0A6T6MFS5_9RHOD|mmetsp:Transcript_3214/g.5648  ORF Transcript_3214/g.5648 Transcript_3214/m.5648 type:complete len:179 (+) Transcript_3214:52-588(+)|eukprot:CAMPEP_0182449832 /NCGR_PEP_ID=MMETSP1172-20130603/37022_1 /TAXON_ID=708627 /ORGANISM="Timspurckia oligopyrenoides, Strain CCMP3278" /LENGTH=178 /DNA_ID=CAMNT_0024647223 /DNA_START=50 /DNA_END=586 /DNA_ORIENTATION=+
MGFAFVICGGVVKSRNVLASSNGNGLRGTCLLKTFESQSSYRSARNSRASLYMQKNEDTSEAPSPPSQGFRLQTNGDVIKFGFIATGALFGIYYALQLFGMDADAAGTAVGASAGIGIVIAWTASYVFRVANKDMTYAQQLRDYEEAVLNKRYEELSEEELAALATELEDETPKKSKK